MTCNISFRLNHLLFCLTKYCSHLFIDPVKDVFYRHFRFKLRSFPFITQVASAFPKSRFIYTDLIAS